MESERVRYLQRLPTVRERCQQVFNLARQNGLQYWSLQESKIDEIVTFCVELIHRDFHQDYDTIPPHGRWRHFLAQHQDRISPMLERWKDEEGVPTIEIGRRMVDLFIVAVLLDAGAGDVWKFIEPTTTTTASTSSAETQQTSTPTPIGRSEGLALGALTAFKAGYFSSDPQTHAMRVDAVALSKLNADQVAHMMQSRPGNEMTGLSGRAAVLQSLGTVLLKGSPYFPAQDGMPPRPGNMIDYLLQHPLTKNIPRPVMRGQVQINLEVLWEAIVSKQGIAGAWPEEGRVAVDGVVVGDVWECKALACHNDGDGWVAFHKLSQWLSYSLIEVLEKVMDWTVMGKEDLTGLPEYRNGGLLIDFGYVQPKPEAFASLLDQPWAGPPTSFPLDQLPAMGADHAAVIEWRALTVIGLDEMAQAVNRRLGTNLELAQVLEAATWKGGREIAQRLRGNTGGGPPFKVLSDGTVF